MKRSPLAALSALVALVALVSQSAAQDLVTFAPAQPMFRLTVRDLPALVAAVEGSSTGKLLADPEVAEAFALGRKNYLQHVATWTELVATLTRLKAGAPTFDMRAEVALRTLDWRDIHTVDFAVAIPNFEQTFYTLLLRPTAAGSERTLKQFAAFTQELRSTLPSSLALGPEQKVGDRPGLVLVPGEAAPDTDGGMWFGPLQPVWLVERDGSLLGGSGTQEIGTFAPLPAGPPSVTLAIDVVGYARMIGEAMGGEPFTPFLEAIGIDKSGMFEWRLHVADGRVQDDLSIALPEKPGGILGALLDGMAPLPDQPLPEHALLQLRCAFDVQALVRAVDQLMELNHLTTLTEQGMHEDLRRAWTGGVSLAVARPAPGSLVPRLYASFGIVDREALDRLLTRLHSQTFLEVKQRKLLETDCVQLSISDLPSGLQPTYCLIDDTVHFAESTASLRALLKARSAGAAKVLDVGDAPRPKGTGAMLPSFDLRFDGVAIHRALHDMWLPLANMDVTGERAMPFVPMADMPDPEVVGAHLGKGRGVLRRTKDRVVVSMSGTLGGPETHALAAAFGPYLSVQFATAWAWQNEGIRGQITGLQLRKVHEAIGVFAKRAGHRPASLGELLASGDLPDAALLLVKGDTLAEPVLHDGKEVAKSSFRYYPKGLKVSIDGESSMALLIAIKKSWWTRYSIDEAGTLHQGWGDFAENKLDDIEKEAKKQ